jgi:hypothetical protein
LGDDPRCFDPSLAEDSWRVSSQIVRCDVLALDHTDNRC